MKTQYSTFRDKLKYFFGINAFWQHISISKKALSMIGLLFVIIIISAFAYKTNNPIKTTTIVNAPVFSLNSGFYESRVKLKIKADKGADVYYTLDGSLPDINSIKYSGPIYIEDKSLTENRWCMRTDVSTGFDVQRILETTDYNPPGYTVPDYLVDKCTVVRAICIDSNGLYSKETIGSYFVGFKNKKEYKNIYVVSLIVEPEALFDYEDGIYVTGKTYDDYLSSDNKNWYDPYWWWWDANYRKKGYASERQAYVEIFDTLRNPIVHQSIGIRVQGGGSRGLLPRSFNLYARDQYDNNTSFPDKLFQTGYSPKVITAFSGADDNIAKLKDYLIQKFVYNKKFSTMNYIPCCIFLDGEFWGVYWLTEKYDKYYCGYYFNVDPNDVIMIKNGLIEEGKAKDINYYTEMKSFISENDMSIIENYQKVCEMIDINSFVEYYAAETFIARNNDWPSGNYSLWRTKNIGEGYADGKWRWMLFDVNSGAYDINNTTEDTVKRLLQDDALFGSLMKNPDFEQLFFSELLSVANECFDLQSVLPFIENYKDSMSAILACEYNRFYGMNNHVYRDGFIKSLDGIKYFFINRNKYVNSYYSKFLLS